MELHEFVLARIYEDQAAARAASAGGRWRYEDGDSVGAWTLYDEHWTIASLETYDTKSYDYSERMPAFRNPGYIDPDVNGRHIARWDPARVLAECEGKRQIIASIRLALRFHPAATLTCPSNPRCACRECVEIRSLALPYVDHPDYREEWRP